MGVEISAIIPRREIDLVELSGKKIAVDAFNNIFQYLSIIRERMTGEPLKDSKGRITSHLSGLFYRTTSWMEIGIRPVFVFDGPPPVFKRRTIEAREEVKKEMKKKWEEALKKGEPAKKYAQAAARLTDEIVESSKKLLEYMGIPWVQAPSEGEAQCAFLCKRGEVWSSVSQDYDALLTGSPRLLRNISISGKRKLPKKEVYVEVKPEIVELEEVLKTLGINREQLIIIGMLVGTDYNEGVSGIGPVSALKLVKEHKTLNSVLKNVEWKSEFDAEEIFNFFLNPPVTEKYELEWKEPDAEKIIEFMVEEHDFSKERVEKVVQRLQESYGKGRQASLKGWFEK